MLRRDFALTTLSATIASTLPALSFAQAAKFEEGKDFIALDKPVPTEAKGKIEVIEFFWYSCPHCNAFEPALEKWIEKLPKDVSLRRVPIAFRDDFAPQQRLFYTLEAMGKVSELHKKVFYAIHVEKQKLADQASIGEWVAKQGVDKAKFDELYSSFAIQTKASRATQLQNAYKVSGVPALGIAGRFYTDGSLSQNMERALQITDWLAAEVRKGK